MSIRGASASCTKVIRSAGIARIASTGSPRDRTWKLSRMMPEPRMVGAAHHLPGVAVVADVPAPGQRLEADLDAEAVGDPAELAQVGRGPVDAAERQRRDVGADEDRTARRARSSAANLRFARSKPRLRCGSGMPSKSRNGWKATISRPWSRTIRPISAGEPSCASTSASKISTPSKPAAAIAASFSGSVPPSETVAIENFMAGAPRDVPTKDGGGCRGAAPVLLGRLGRGNGLALAAGRIGPWAPATAFGLPRSFMWHPVGLAGRPGGDRGDAR